MARTAARASADLPVTSALLEGVPLLIPSVPVREDRFDAVRSTPDVLVLPDSYDGPAGGRQSVIVAAVASDVAIELDLPVVAVRAWARPMLGTPVPKAPIDEDGDPARANTMSTLQRSPFTGAVVLRNRYPRRWNSERKASSGSVSTARFPFITARTPGVDGAGG